jgi:HPt (histidine-containing phosphotransfer) domain-containing protein
MWFVTFRGSFWLAALAAALRLIAPGEHATALTAVAAVAGALALATWRLSLTERLRGAPAKGPLLPPVSLDWPALADAAARVAAACDTAPTFGAALQASAAILRSETGAQRVSAVLAPPPSESPSRLTAFADSAVLPVTLDDRVAGVIALDDIVLTIEPAALHRLLEQCGHSLAARAARETAADDSTGLTHTDARRILWLTSKEGGEIATVLRRLGVQVTQITFADDAGRAARAPAETQCDLVLVDVDEGDEGASPSDAGMPVGGVPRVALSRRARPEDEQYFVERGFDALVCQPLADGRLHAMLSRFGIVPLRQAADELGGSAPRAMQLDAVALARLADLDPKGENRLLERVLRAYQTSIARLMPQFVEARQNGNLDMMRQVTHTLKSSSASIGAIKFSQLCAEIETMIRSERTEGLDASADALCGELAFVLEAVKQLLDNRP